MKAARDQQLAQGARAHDPVVPTKNLTFREIAKIINQRTGENISHQRIMYLHERALKKLKLQLQENPVLEQKFLELL